MNNMSRLDDLVARRNKLEAQYVTFAYGFDTQEKAQKYLEFVKETWTSRYGHVAGAFDRANCDVRNGLIASKDLRAAQAVIQTWLDEG